MKKLIYIFPAVALFFFSCSTTSPKPECGKIMCTLEFRMLQVHFKDSSGNSLVVKNYSAINKRTGESTITQGELLNPNSQGVYVVANDADVKKFSEAGDVIIVSASHPTTNKKATAEFVITGGMCACHINKVSGPSEIML